MRTETKIMVTEVAITKEERDTLSRVYQLATQVYDNANGGNYNTYSFATMLDMIMSDLVDAEQYNDEFIVDLTEYYT